MLSKPTLSPKWNQSNPEMTAQSCVCCLVFEVKGGLGVDKDLKRLNVSINGSDNESSVPPLSPKCNKFKPRNDSSVVCCLVLDIDGCLGVDKDLKSLNFSIHGSARQKGFTTLWAITGQFAEDSDGSTSGWSILISAPSLRACSRAGIFPPNVIFKRSRKV